MPELTKIQTGFLEPQGPFKLDPGTESAPGIYLEGDENTGLYRSAENEIGVSIDGTQKYNFTSEGLKFNGTSLDGTPFMGAIDKDINDTATATDIFVYDTSKDSDGGAWRKRTQHTSWYNETLNTETRGSRREFPAVAVIVTQSDTLTIYDGDDPDLPMWMKFTTTGTVTANAIVRTDGYNISTVSMINGHLTTGVNYNGMFEINFISDKCHRRNPYVYAFGGNIASRNGGMNFITISSAVIVETTINDVAMTVLPNAPIDDATGLPIPTIAVATNGGVSVIKDDGTVVNYTRGASNEYTGSVAFDELNDLIISWGTSPGGYRHATRITNPFIGSTSLDTTYGYIASDLGMGGSAAGNTGGVVTVANSGRHFGIDFDSSSGVPSAQNNHDDRVNFLHINDVDTTKSLVAYATTSYNTGWMHGSIKGAFLSDKTVESFSPLNLVTEDFSANWTGSTGGVLSVSSGQLTITNTGTNGRAVSNQFATTTGKKYAFIAKGVSSTGGGTYRLEVRGPELVATSLTAGTFVIYFNGTGNSTTYVELYAIGGSGVSVTYEDAYVVELEEDRSVNDKGLQVFGTINKSPVAGSGDTAAELVAYSGFSNSTNYLSQPLNSDLAIGNSDFSCVGWFKKSTSSNTGMIIFASDGNDQVFDVRVHTDMKMLAQITDDGFSTREIVSAQGPTVNDNIWHQFHAVRRSNTLYSYLDGNLLGSSATVEANITNSMGITIGAENLTANQKAFEGSISLIRFSNSAPSPEQIKKMYEDEKVLFQENAACTLYGSSDAVTALAYDEVTERLHVGTSSGRSEFQGLRRINNTTTAVTTAISAHDEFIVEQ